MHAAALAHSLTGCAYERRAMRTVGTFRTKFRLCAGRGPCVCASDVATRLGRLMAELKNMPLGFAFLSFVFCVLPARRGAIRSDRIAEGRRFGD